MDKILISACLMGAPVRYNNTQKPAFSEFIERWRRESRLVIHCPELAAGLTIPRLPAELVNGPGSAVLEGRARVLESDGRDVTQFYLLGAWLALEAARANNCRYAVMTEGSPTCGSQKIYNGEFTGTTIAGQGVAVALLRENGITVFNEYQLADLDVALHTS